MASASAPTMFQLSQYSNYQLNTGGFPFANPFNLRFAMPQKNETAPMGYGWPTGMGDMGPEM